MPELLTAKDVELKVFKKVSFGGYSIADVEEFLNQTAEDLETYVLRLNDQQRRMHELEEALKRYEAMKDTIKDALILAQQSAKEKEEDARRQAALILAKAESRAGEIDVKYRRRLEEAESAADDIIATARAAAAQITQSAEEMKEEAQKRLDGAEAEIVRRMEGRRREMDALAAEKSRFLNEAGELAANFTRIIGEAANKRDISPAPPGGEAAVS